jgi:hypothetical protein
MFLLLADTFGYCQSFFILSAAAREVKEEKTGAPRGVPANIGLPNHKFKSAPCFNSQGRRFSES